MEFKGTKGKWVLVGGWDNDGKGCFPSVIIHGTEQSFKNNYGRNGITINVSHDQRAESIMANAQIIAHAPEMYNEIKESITDLLCIQANVLDALKTDNRWEGVYEILQKQIDRKKDLLKRATTI